MGEVAASRPVLQEPFGPSAVSLTVSDPDSVALLAGCYVSAEAAWRLSEEADEDVRRDLDAGVGTRFKDAFARRLEEAAPWDSDNGGNGFPATAVTAETDSGGRVRDRCVRILKERLLKAAEDTRDAQWFRAAVMALAYEASAAWMSGRRIS